MKAIVFEKTQQLSVQEKPIPALTDGDVLIQTKLCGICASDLAALRGDVSDYAPPVVMGHELAGVIVDSRHPDAKIGERVTVNPMLSCGACLECKNDLDKYCNTIEGIGHDIDGGYAEYMRMPKARCGYWQTDPSPRQYTARRIVISGTVGLLLECDAGNAF